ncbi:MAG: prolyl oligopeptidase family serine peptidase [Bryobacteraceae bacterium]
MQLQRLISVFALLAVAALDAKNVITHETMWLMKRIGAPAASPDGKWVVFPVTEPAYDAKDQMSDLWIVPADGSAKPRRLTFTRGAESDVAWSPDSRRIAFATQREGDEAAQIYLLDIAGGGEAIRLTNISTGASTPVWRPDGKAMLFTSRVYPGAVDDAANRKAASERRARKYSANVYDSFPIRYWDRWLDDRRAHLMVQPVDSPGTARDVLANTKLAAEAGFGGSQSDTGEELHAAWAPDGRSVVFAATTSRHQSAYAFSTTQLYQAPAEGGEPKRLTSGDDNYSNPAFSPDGKALYCLANLKGRFAYTLDRLAMFDWPNPAERTVITAKFDRSVNTFGVTPDSRRVYFLAEDSGHEKLFEAPTRGGEVKPAFDMSLGVYTRLSAPAQASSPVLIANWESAVNPAEVVRIDPVSGKHQALTSFNPEAASQIDWQPLRHFWFTSKRGRRIHNMIVLPPTFDESKKYPLFVLIHGGAHNMWRDQFFVRWNYHLLAAPGYVILLTNYTGSTGFGETFAQNIQNDPLLTPGNELNEAADEAIRRFAFIDGSRQAAGGASYGGHLANWLQATTTRYKCLISHAGLINLESQWGTSDGIYHREVNNGGPVWEQGPVWREQNPIRLAKNFKTPILLTAGERDFRVPLNQTLENWSVLQRLGIPSRLVVFPEANHWIMRGEDSKYFYQEVRDWLKKYL